MSMERQMVMVSTFGRMEVLIRVILAMELGMVMEYGKIKNRIILGHIGLTIRKGLVFILGKIKGFIRASSKTILEKVMGKCLVSIALLKILNQHTREHGKQEIKIHPFKSIHRL